MIFNLLPTLQIQAGTDDGCRLEVTTWITLLLRLVFDRVLSVVMRQQGRGKRFPSAPHLPPCTLPSLWKPASWPSIPHHIQSPAGLSLCWALDDEWLSVFHRDVNAERCPLTDRLTHSHSVFYFLQLLPATLLWMLAFPLHPSSLLFPRITISRLLCEFRVKIKSFD